MPQYIVCEGMADPSAISGKMRCLNCGFEASVNSDEWKTTEHPPLGTLTQCPNCSSTNTSRLR